MRRALVAFLFLLGTLGARAQQASPPAGEARVDYRNSLLLLQSEVSGQIVDGTGFVVKGGPLSLALTSYEAVKGAATIQALVPEHGLVMARLLRFAPDANLALLELPVPDLPPLRLGDSDLVRAGEPIQMVTATALREGRMATAMNPIARKGEIANVLSRPGGVLFQLRFDMMLGDQSSGAPVISGNSGDIVGLALSREAAPSDMSRLAVPVNLAAALDPNLGRVSASSQSVRVLDGSQAPMQPGPSTAGTDRAGLPWLGLGVGLAVLVAAALALRRRGARRHVPFENLPRLPEGTRFAFIDSHGNILPMERDIIRVGRAQDNDWAFNNASVSNYHARIRRLGPSEYEVEDLRSTNGTFVGDRKLVDTESVLPGTVVRFGKVEIMLMARGQVN